MQDETCTGSSDALTLCGADLQLRGADEVLHDISICHRHASRPACDARLACRGMAPRLACALSKLCVTMWGGRLNRFSCPGHETKRASREIRRGAGCRCMHTKKTISPHVMRQPALNVERHRPSLPRRNLPTTLALPVRRQISCGGDACKPRRCAHRGRFRAGRRC